MGPALAVANLAADLVIVVRGPVHTDVLHAHPAVVSYSALAISAPTREGSHERSRVAGMRSQRLCSACEDQGMTSYVFNMTVDCADAYALSRWWQTVLDYIENPDDPNEPGYEECMIYSRDQRHRS